MGQKLFLLQCLILASMLFQTSSAETTISKKFKDAVNNVFDNYYYLKEKIEDASSEIEKLKTTRPLPNITNLIENTEKIRLLKKNINNMSEIKLVDSGNCLKVVNESVSPIINKIQKKMTEAFDSHIANFENKLEEIRRKINFIGERIMVYFQTELGYCRKGVKNCNLTQKYSKDLKDSLKYLLEVPVNPVNDVFINSVKKEVEELITITMLNLKNDCGYFLSPQPVIPF